MNHLFEILNIDDSTIIVIGKTYYGIDDYISELETELAKRQFRGEIIFDLLLANGLYAKNRFIHSSYYGDRIIDFELEGIEKGKLNTLKELLKVKLGTLSSPLEKQLTNTSLEKLNVLILNIFNINSEEDVLKIIN